MKMMSCSARYNSQCKGFDITMAQFFAEGEMIEMIWELKELFDCWRPLTPEQEVAALQMIKAVSHNN